MPIIALLSPIDYGVLALFVAALLGIGAYASARQKDTTEHFLAGRSLGWLPLGMSLAAIFVSLLTFTALPAAAYDRGWKCWIVVLALWVALPVVAFVAIPAFRGLGLVSVYEYLELRFDSRVRLAASLIFVVWRMVWLVAAIYLPSEGIRLAAGWNVPTWLVAVPLGGLATLVAFLGGMRSVAWSGVLKGLALFAGVTATMVGAWMALRGGPERVAEITRGLSRLEPVELNFAWADPWSLWGALPFWVLTVLTFCLADQVAVQRFLAAKNENLARTAYLCCILALSLLLPALAYVGMGLLAFYHDRPQEMRPEWVANVDGRTRQSVLGPDGKPLLDRSNPAHAITFENIDRLVAEGRILQPNNKEPFTSAVELIDPDTNRVRVERLAMRKPNSGGLRGEIIVHQDAPAEMLPVFARQQLSWGAAGLVLAALLAAALAAVDAGLNSLSTVLTRDLMSRFGWGKAWLARRVSKPPNELTPADELQLARPMTLAIGMLATLGAAVLGLLVPLADAFALLISVTSALGAPLVAVMLLGLVTRRTTATSAFVALVSGTVATLGLGIVAKLAWAGAISPDLRFANIWPAIGGFGFTISVGYVLSLVAGRRMTPADLRGLVAGCGELGRRAVDETVPLISVPDAADEIRWK